MADSSAIEWTDATWNPVTGCSKVSPGCAHCYAEELTQRFAETWGVPGLPWTPANAAENVILHPERLDQPLRWKKPRRVFVNSMSDLFHEQVPGEFIARVFNVMARSPQHVFQVLTKRPERMRDWVGYCEQSEAFISHNGQKASKGGIYVADLREQPWPLPNVWLGVSIENRRFVHRADLLRETPAAVRFISAEPLLGPLAYDQLVTDHPDDDGEWCWADGYDGEGLDLDGIDWLIAGGESGARHRPIAESWVADLRDLAQASMTAFFFKQWGGRTPKANGRELDGRTWDEFPAMPEPMMAGGIRGGRG